MSKKCKAYSESKLGLEPPDNRKAFYAGWDAALAAEQPKPEPVVLAKDWLKMTLRVNRGDRVFHIERRLHLSEIKQSHFPLVPETADLAWQELNAEMKEGT